MILRKEAVVRSVARLVPGIFLLQSIEEEHFVRALVLGFDTAARLQFKEPVDTSSHGFADIDPPRDPARFHEPRGVDGIAPDIERHPATANYTGDDRPGMYADAQVQRIFSNRLAPHLQVIEPRPHL